MEQETGRRPAWKVDVQMACIWASRHPRERSSWRKEVAFGSQERSGERQRERNGNETTWR